MSKHHLIHVMLGQSKNAAMLRLQSISSPLVFDKGNLYFVDRLPEKESYHTFAIKSYTVAKKRVESLNSFQVPSKHYCIVYAYTHNINIYLCK